MIQLFQTKHTQLAEIDNIQEGCWINIVDPNLEERQWIMENNALIAEYLSDSLDTDELSRVEKEEDYLLIVLRLPHFRGIEHDVPFTTIPLLILLTDQIFVTVCKEENVIIQEFIRERIKGFSTSKRYKFLLQIMMKTATRYLLHLRNINKIVERLEDELENSLRNKELIELLKYEKALIYYTNALKNNETMLERMRRMRVFNAFEEDEEFLEEVIIENRQAIEMTSITQRILAQMMNAYSSVINNNMNNIMKTLTLVTICIAIPNLFASFYGMNVNLPASEYPHIFYVVMGVSFLLIMGLFVFIKRKNWF